MRFEVPPLVMLLAITAVLFYNNFNLSVSIGIKTAALILTIWLLFLLGNLLVVNPFTAVMF